MSKTYARGEMYYADLGKGIGSEQEGFRPVVIIQNDIGNKYSPTVIVAPLSSSVNKKELPTHYHVDHEDGLGSPSVILLEQIRTIDKHRLVRRIGKLSEQHMRGLDRACAISVGLDESTQHRMRIRLCKSCSRKFYGTGAFILKRMDYEVWQRENCSYCGQSSGFDYEIALRYDSSDVYVSNRSLIHEKDIAIDGAPPKPVECFGNMEILGTAYDDKETA